MTRIILSLAAAGALVLPAAHAHAGWTAKLTASSGAGPEKRTQSVQLAFDNGTLRVDQDADSTLIVDLKTGKVTGLRHSTKQHASLTLEQQVQMMQSSLAQMKAQLPQLPPEIKAMAEQQIKVIESGTPPIENTGKKDKANGYDCAIYSWKAPNGDGEACVATKVGADLGDFTKAASALVEKRNKMVGGKGSPADMVLLQFGKIGLPVRTKRTVKQGGMSIDVVEDISEIKEAKIDAAKFAVPADYKEGDLQAVLAGPRG
jgi:hypothetical protein